MQRIVVIGAGISGLSAAFQVLEKRPSADLVVLEASARAGGLIKTDVIDDFIVEQGPDSILTEKPQALELARRLGLEQEIIPTNSKHRGAFVLSRGQLQRIPEGFSMMAPTQALPILGSKILSPWGKLRMMSEVLLPRGASQQDESIASFVQRRFGREVLERLAQPLMSGIYGSDPAELSLQSTMPRFIEMERSHRSVTLGMLARRRQREHASGVRYGMFVAFKRGNQTLTDALAERLGERLRLNTRVEAVARQPGDATGYHLQLAGGDSLTASAVIVALPARVMAPIFAELAPELSEQLDAIQFGSTATVAYGFDSAAIAHPLDGFGFVVPTAEQRRILASTWASRKFAGRAPAGKALIRVFFGGAHDPAAPRLDDDALVQLGLSELNSIIGVKGAPLFTSVGRQLDAMPKYALGHQQRVQRIGDALGTLPGLALAGNSLYGVGIPDSIAAGERAAERVLADSD